MMEAVRTSETSVDNHFIILHGSISQKTTLNTVRFQVLTTASMKTTDVQEARSASMIRAMTEAVKSTDHELIPARNARLAECTVPRPEVMFVAIQRENIRPSKKEINKAVTMLIMPDVCS
jgi:hypothetical protein